MIHNKMTANTAWGKNHRIDDHIDNIQYVMRPRRNLLLQHIKHELCPQIVIFQFKGGFEAFYSFHLVTKSEVAESHHAYYYRRNLPGSN